MNNNRCISCGAVIPEGRQVCPNCESDAIKKQEEIERAEAQICQGCPYPKDRIDSCGRGCVYYRTEMKKIREKYRKGKKENGKDKQHIKSSA